MLDSMNDCIEIIVEKTDIEVEVRDGEVTIDPLRHDCVSNVSVTEEHDVVVEIPQQPWVEVEPKQDPCVCPDVQQTEMVIMRKGDLEEVAKEVVEEETADIRKEVAKVPQYEVSVEEEGTETERVYRIRQPIKGLDVVIRTSQPNVITDGYVEDHPIPFEYKEKLYPAGTYIVLVLADKDSTKLYIDAGTLIKSYQGLDTDTISTTVKDYKISAIVRPGSIQRSMLAFHLHEVTADEMIAILDKIDAEDDGK